MESMTGFGKGVISRDNFQIHCYIKSLNHRYLDITCKLPKRYQLLEERIRKKLGETFIRGKIELTLRVFGLSRERREIFFDLELVRNLKENLERLKKELSLKGKISLGDLLQFRDWVSFEDKEEELESLWEEVKPVLEIALSDLKRARLEEGKRIERLLKEDLQKLKWIAQELKALKEDTRRENFQRTLERVRQLLMELDLKLEEGRIYQEIAFLLEKMDFTEELDRFQIHLDNMERLLEEPATGKKLDFLCQEMYREINTLAYKAQSAKVSTLVIQAKDLIEKIREQVQNVV
ncbi:MAG: YicC family protein [Caldimicrobium sp.]|nr:YicC family protein [Caldimicrobium sp.]MCX7874059.1 YicC family protein [Caldimicrobium sp.]MDW8093883.1 YicC/YloC family endoribonuclease [Caldimicrobium sp.]